MGIVYELVSGASKLLARFSTRGSGIPVREQVHSATVATGQLHLLLALAARKLPPLQHTLTYAPHTTSGTGFNADSVISVK